MSDWLYEEVLTGNYLHARHKKWSRTEVTPSQPNEYDLNCFSNNLRGDYISRFKSHVVECSESLSEQTSVNNNQTDKESEAEQLVFLVDEQLGSEAKSKPCEPLRESVLQLPCKNIKEYREGSKPISPGIDMYSSPHMDHDSTVGTIEKERREVEDAIERYTQARIYASFESFLQDKKPCYVEKCGFRRPMSPELMSSQQDRAVADDLMKQTDTSSPHRLDWRSVLAEDACDETYDRVNRSGRPASPCRSNSSSSSSSLSSSSTESDATASISPFTRSYTVQIGTRANRTSRSHGLDGVEAVSCSHAPLPAYTSHAHHSHDDDEDDDEEEEEEDDEDDGRQGVSKEGIGGFPDIAEC